MDKKDAEIIEHIHHQGNNILSSKATLPRYIAMKNNVGAMAMTYLCGTTQGLVQNYFKGMCGQPHGLSH